MHVHGQKIIIIVKLYFTVQGLLYERGSICNENPFIPPSTNALGFYAICQTKDQSVAVIMVRKHYFIFPNLISYRLSKKHTNIHCLYFPSNSKDSF